MKSILITGATGFIGSWLTRYFIQKGFQVIAHGSSNETIGVLKDKLIQNRLPVENVAFWEQNFLERKWEFPNFSKLGFLIHCAAVTSVRNSTRDNYDQYFTVNVLGTKKLVERAFDHKIGHFIHLSSGQIYGKPKSFPITQRTPKEPINMYGFTKLMGEEIIKSFGTFGLPYTIARPFSVYGEGHSNIISIIFEKLRNSEPITIYGDGTQTRAFMHIKDICTTIELILRNQNALGREYNLSGPKEYPINELVSLISKALGITPEIRYKESGVNEIKRNLADISPLKELGFQFNHTLENFIEQR